MVQKKRGDNRPSMIKLRDVLLLENDSKDRGGVLYSWNGKYLLCKGEASGKWNVPKGHIKEGESPLEGSVREFLEETQISLQGIPKLLDSWNNKGGKFYLYSLKGTKRLVPKLNHEHTDWGYFSSYELPSPINKDIEKIIKQKHGISETYYGTVMRNVLLERVDYYDTAQQLVKQYGLKSKIKMGRGKDFGEYVPETDTITLRPHYKSIKEFLLTILHEIGHALDAKRLGVKKYIKKYTQAGTMATYHGLDPHDDNKWEEKAERFARKELSKWL